jgi:deoxycytidylate deaminase
VSRKHDITALIYNKRGRLVSMGKNDYARTHPLQARCACAVGEPHRIFIHAEIAALVRLKDWTQAHSIHVARYTRDGQPADARPCKACSHALQLAGIKNISFTTGKHHA